MKSITGSGTMYFILSLRLRARLQYNKDKSAVFCKSSFVSGEKIILLQLLYNI